MTSMYELTGKVSGVSFSMEGKPLVTLELNERKSALAMVDELKAAEKLSVKIGKYRQKRSLDANAYFHLLVNKIAAESNQSDEAVKKKLVLDYGTIARDEDGQIYGAMLPSSADIDMFYPYAKSYKEMQIDGKEYTCYLFYKRTRNLDSKEFARLIEGTVYEAKQLGIETMTPEELSRLEGIA